MNNTINNKLVLFLLVCMSTRILISLIFKYINIKYIKILGYLLLIPATGLLLIYIFGLRKTGILNQTSWWNHLRPLHSLLYFIAAFYAIKQDRLSWLILLLDACIGLIAFLINHFILN